MTPAELSRCLQHDFALATRFLPLLVIFLWLAVAVPSDGYLGRARINMILHQAIGAHGFQDLVTDDKVQFQVSLQWVNRSAGPAAYSPDQFRLGGDAGQTSAGPASGTLMTGKLPARSTLDTEIDFVGGERVSDHLAFLEQELNIRQHVRLVAFDQPDAVAGAVQDGLCDVALGMQGIRGHDAIGEYQRLQHILDPEQLIAFVSDGLLRQRDAQAMAECREQMRPGCTLFLAAPQGLAVNGAALGLPGRGRLAHQHLVRPLAQLVFELRAVQVAEDPRFRELNAPGLFWACATCAISHARL